MKTWPYQCNCIAHERVHELVQISSFSPPQSAVCERSLQSQIAESDLVSFLLPLCFCHMSIICQHMAGTTQIFCMCTCLFVFFFSLKLSLFLSPPCPRSICSHKHPKSLSSSCGLAAQRQTEHVSTHSLHNISERPCDFFSPALFELVKAERFFFFQEENII